MSCNKQPALQCNYDITLQTRTRSSVKPPKSVWPSADHAIDTHSGSLTLLVSERSGLSSSTIDLKISVRITSGLPQWNPDVLALQVEDFYAAMGGSA